MKRCNKAERKKQHKKPVVIQMWKCIANHELPEAGITNHVRLSISSEKLIRMFLGKPTTGKSSAEPTEKIIISAEAV